jgi:hypothetical protein
VATSLAVQPPPSTAGKPPSHVDMTPPSFAMMASSRPGSPSSRANRVEACVTCTPAMLEAENVYHSHGLAAVILYDDPWFHVSRDEVKQAMGGWMGVHRHDIRVELFPPQGFLLLLPLLDL